MVIRMFSPCSLSADKPTANPLFNVLIHQENWFDLIPNIKRTSFKCFISDPVAFHITASCIITFYYLISARCTNEIKKLQKNIKTICTGPERKASFAHFAP